MAKVNWEIEIPVSVVRGNINTPRLCRIPMLSVSITDTPIKMDKLALIILLLAVYDLIDYRTRENFINFINFINSI